VSTSTSEHRADEGATLPAVQVRGKCSFGMRREESPQGFPVGPGGGGRRRRRDFIFYSQATHGLPT